MKQYDIKLDEKEIRLVLTALGNLAYSVSHELVTKLGKIIGEKTKQKDDWN